MEYVLRLNEGDRSARHTTTLHIMLAFLLFGVGVSCMVLFWFTIVAPAFRGVSFTPFLIFGLVAFVMSGVLLWLTVRAKNWIRQQRNNTLLRVAEIALMLGATGLFLWAGWRIPSGLFGIMSVVLLFALLTERRTGTEAKALFTPKEIQLTGARHKAIRWSGVEKVILRHHILTISLANNVLIQRDVAPETTLPPAEFEQWCSQQIESGRTKRDEEW